MKIRLEIDQCETYDEIKIVIMCPKIDERLEKIIQHIKQSQITIVGIKERQTFYLSIEDLYYIEAVDNQTFLYDELYVYESSLKLYELEKSLSATTFIRISKSLILNTIYVKSVKALFNGRFEAILTNNEKVIVNRHYVKKFKEKILK